MVQGKRFKLVTTLGAPVIENSVADGVRMAQEIGDLGIEVQLVADTGAGYHMERSVPHQLTVGSNHKLGPNTHRGVTLTRFRVSCFRCIGCTARAKLTI